MADARADHVIYFQYFHMFRQWRMHAQTTWYISNISICYRQWLMHAQTTWYISNISIYYRQWLMHAQTTWSTSKCLTYRSGMGSMVLSDWKAREGKVSKFATQNQQSAVNTCAQHKRTPRFKSGSDFFGLSDSLKVQCVSIIKPVLGQSLTHQITHPSPLLTNHVKK